MLFDAKHYWNNRLQNQYDLVGVGDISLSKTYNKWSYKVTRCKLRKLFKKYVHSGKESIVVDIGSGTGFVVDIWKELGKNVIGVDISEVAVQRLKQAFPNDSFLECDIAAEPLGIGKNSVACVSAASVLYHITSDEGLRFALKNIHNILQSGGLFIFSDNFIHTKPLVITHQNCRTLTDYEVVLNETGFEIIDRVANYVLMNHPVDARNKWYPRFWGRITNLSRRYKLFDRVIWPMLFPIELLLTSIKKESPAQEFMICRAVK